MRSVKNDVDEMYSGFYWNSISVDRINPNGGYLKKNVRFLLNQINIFKQNGPDSRMYELAEALLKNKK